MAGPTRSRPADEAVLEGRYRLDGLIARGGMSVVHRGMDLRLDRPVAIKILDRALAEDPVFVRRFEREARAAARLAHPGVVAVHDQGRDADGTTFLVLELVEGGTLRDVLREHGRLRPAEALTVMEQVVVALSVAHERGLVHRDVKPENVLVSAAGAVKVADFGLVGAAWDRSGATGDGGTEEPAGSDELILGTVAYLSPEQVADGRADARSDLYAAGVVLFELLTGVPPHGGDTAAEVAAAHVHTDIPPPSRLVSGIPRALDTLVVSLTRRDPDDRPRDATAFLAEARRVRAATELPFQRVPPPPVRATVPPPPRPLGGTRAFEPDDLGGLDDHDDRADEPDDRGDADDLDDLDDGADADDGDEGDPHPRRRGAARPAVDDVDDRIERLARRRARTRSRRVLAVWVIGVAAATVVAGLAGWDLGAPVP